MKHKLNVKKLAWILPFALSAGLTASAANSKHVAPDNTKKNERDTRTELPTAQDQSKGSDSDVALTREIRQEIVKDDSLSTNAKNVKIITLGGVVTLRGPVASAAEKAKIATAAKHAAGVKRVDNKLEVKVE
jgi:hyperosmotically inducible protein